MAIEIAKVERSPIEDSLVARLARLPVSILGDELNRTAIMQAAIKPVSRPACFAGRALTVECTAGDNSAIHYALEKLQPGDVLVADARAHVDTAVWGEILHACAEARGAAAVVIDGSIRDSVAIAASGLPAYVRGVCPRGPHKGWGGSINHEIQCGGVPVSPGDIVIGDDDGVIVIKPATLLGLAERCDERIKMEEEALARVRSGELTTAVFKMPPLG